MPAQLPVLAPADGAPAAREVPFHHPLRPPRPTRPTPPPGVEPLRLLPLCLFLLLPTFVHRHQSPKREQRSSRRCTGGQRGAQRQGVTRLAGAAGSSSPSPSEARGGTGDGAMWQGGATGGGIRRRRGPRQPNFPYCCISPVFPAAVFPPPWPSPPPHLRLRPCHHRLHGCRPLQPPRHVVHDHGRLLAQVQSCFPDNRQIVSRMGRPLLARASFL